MWCAETSADYGTKIMACFIKLIELTTKTTTRIMRFAFAAQLLANCNACIAKFVRRCLTSTRIARCLSAEFVSFAFKAKSNHSTAANAYRNSPTRWLKGFKLGGFIANPMFHHRHRCFRPQTYDEWAVAICFAEQLLGALVSGLVERRCRLIDFTT